MNITLRIAAAIAVFGVPCTGFGQSAPASSPGTWSIGVGLAMIDSPYAGEGTRVRPLPLVGYEGERVFVRGVSAGIHAYESGPFAFDLLLSARLDGFDVGDLGGAELLANGVDPALLSDRDDGFDAGFRASVGSIWGAISVAALHDVSGTSDGYEIALDYRYTWSRERRTLTARAGASWLSDDLAGYYFGTLDEEVARGVAAYSPGSAVISHLGLTSTHALGTSPWRLSASVEYRLLPNELSNGPLLDSGRDATAHLMLGLIRRL